MPQCTSNDFSRTKTINEEKLNIQRIRKDMLKKAFRCADSTLPYENAGVKRDALWQQWGIDSRERFSEYRRKLLPEKIDEIKFKKLDIKFALLLSLFWADNEEQACEAMYAFGQPLTVVPPMFYTVADDIIYGCYRVLQYVYANCSSTSADSQNEKEKKRVDRLLCALDYISDKENAEQNLYAFFFEK